MPKKLSKEPSTPSVYNPLTASFEFRREVADSKTHGPRSVGKPKTNSLYKPESTKH